MSVRAVHVASYDDFVSRKLTGSIYTTDPDSDGEISFFYTCPCGCKEQWPLVAGKQFKPVLSPSWNWNGSTEAATLTPSVNHVGHWHGYLTDGQWTTC